jgi:hypothetical protein
VLISPATGFYLSQMNPTHTYVLFNVNYNMVPHLRLWLSNFLVPSGFPNENLYATVISPIIIVIIINGSTVLVTTLAASHRRFRNQIETLGRLLCTSHQPVAKASTYTGQHKINIYISSGIRTHDPTNQVAKTYALDRAATGIVISSITQCNK